MRGFFRRILSGFDELKVCVAYRCDGKTLNTFPADAYTLSEIEPVYESFAGWREDLTDCRSFGDLPAPTQNYVREISRRLETPVGIVSVGPDRAQTILVEPEA